MDIRVRAALYTITYFVGIVLLGITINSILPYLEAWMGWTALFAGMIYMVYSLMLANLKFDESLAKSVDGLNEVIGKK